MKSERKGLDKDSLQQGLRTANETELHTQDFSLAKNANQKPYLKRVKFGKKMN